MDTCGQYHAAFFINFSNTGLSHNNKYGQIKLAIDNSYVSVRGQSLFTGLDHWTGLLDWNTGLNFDPKIAYKKLYLAPYT